MNVLYTCKRTPNLQIFRKTKRPSPIKRFSCVLFFYLPFIVESFAKKRTRTYIYLYELWNFLVNSTYIIIIINAACNKLMWSTTFMSKIMGFNL